MDFGLRLLMWPSLDSMRQLGSNASIMAKHAMVEHRSLKLRKEKVHKGKRGGKKDKSKSIYCENLGHFARECIESKKVHTFSKNLFTYLISGHVLMA